MQHNRTDHNATQRNATQQIQHSNSTATQLNRYNITATQQITMQPNKTDTTQWIAAQRSATQHNGLQRNTTDTTQQNSPQHNKTGNKNHAHMLNKPVEATSSWTKNSTDKNSRKPLQVY